MTTVLNFLEFIDTHYKYYKVDAQCHGIIKLLHYYAIGDERFEKMPDKWQFKVDGNVIQKKLSLRKGILLFGNVGSGKTDLLRILNMYNRYLNSPFTFKTGVVWKYADAYRSSGAPAFDKITFGNYMFDELCLTDQQTCLPAKEKAQYMGNWILAGEEVIRLRYEDALPRGFVTHFTTNEKPDKLKEAYGERAFSRLVQMCNMIPLVGNDRRYDEEPVVHNDFRMQTFQPEPINAEELDKESKAVLDRKLSTFKVMQNDAVFSAYDFDGLRRLGCTVCTDEELYEVHTPLAKEVRLSQVNRKFDRNQKRLLQMHTEGKFDDEEQRNIMTIAKQKAVVTHAAELIKTGKDTFFVK